MRDSSTNLLKSSAMFMASRPFTQNLMALTPRSPAFWTISPLAKLHRSGDWSRYYEMIFVMQEVYLHIRIKTGTMILIGLLNYQSVSDGGLLWWYV